ncbi:MAG: enoyl-CoA hydratase/isomerase family protein [Halobacteria archaeon]
MDPEFQAIRYHLDGKVARLTLHRPEKRNALSVGMREEILGVLEAAASEKGVGLLLITGSDPAFCAGFDLDDFKSSDRAFKQRLFETSAAYHRRLWEFPKPVLAAVNGQAFGGGFDLATLCDIRIASDRALFAHPEIKFGAPPLFTPLRWIVGEGHARDLCFTGRRIDAREAHRIGLVSEVVEHDRLLRRALEVAKTILEAPGPTLQATKGYMARAGGRGFEESFREEHDEVFRKFLGVK